MSDSISDLYDDYEEYEYFCKKYNQTPKNMGETGWLHELSNFKHHPKFKKGPQYSIAEKLKIGTFRK